MIEILIISWALRLFPPKARAPRYWMICSGGEHFKQVIPCEHESSRGDLVLEGGGSFNKQENPCGPDPSFLLITWYVSEISIVPLKILKSSATI